MNAVVILPCPFCGDTDPSIDEIDNNLWSVVCNDCGAIGPHLTDDGGATVGAKAIELWNRRHTAAEAALAARPDSHVDTTPEEAAQIIIDDLIARKGFDAAWDACDDSIRQEITEEIAGVIRSAARPAEDGLALSRCEIRAVTESPEALLALADYHQVQLTMGDAMDFDVSFHAKREKELREAAAALGRQA